MRYRFANARHRDLFKANPEKYAPQFGGSCTMNMSNGVRREADPTVWVISNGNLYVFASSAPGAGRTWMPCHQEVSLQSRPGFRQCRHGNLTSQHSSLSPTLLRVDDGTLACDRCGAPVSSTVKFCGECGAPVAQAQPSAEVRKTVTALFCDVTGSTALGAGLDPEALRDLMERYFTQVSRVLARHGGTVEKFVGDAVMAVFGVPAAHEDDAVRACRAATEILQVVGEVDAQVAAAHGARFAVRIGIETGEVLVGDVSREAPSPRGPRSTSRPGWSRRPTPASAWSDPPACVWSGTPCGCSHDQVSR